MKKLLLASTALVATAGFAVADVSVTGSAEMGIKREAGADRTEFHTDINVDFALSGESDNGISFGAEIGLEEAQDGVATDIEDDYTVFISAGNATLTMGDTDGAYDARLAETGGPAGSIADDHTEHAGYDGQGGGVDSGFDAAEDGQVARFDYAFDALTLSVSVELDDDGETDAVAGTAFVAGSPATLATTGSAADDNDNPVWGLGVSYNAELAGLDLGVGLGYQKQEDTGSVVGLSLSTTFDNGLSAVLIGSQTEFEASGTETETHWGIGLGYSMNALAIGVNYGIFENRGGVDGQTESGVGLAAQYDFGGGLVGQFGFGSSEVDGADSTDMYSLGLAMSF